MEVKDLPDIQLADSGYGQGKMMVNPVHMAAIYTAFSNNGNMLKPYLVKENGSKTSIKGNYIYQTSCEYRK